MHALQAIRGTGRLDGLARALLLTCSLLLWPFVSDFSSVAAQEPSSGELITLPEVRHDGELSLEGAVSERRSVRNYAEVALSVEDLSQLLWAAQASLKRSRRRQRTGPAASGWAGCVPRRRPAHCIRWSCISWPAMLPISRPDSIAMCRWSIHWSAWPMAICERHSVRRRTDRGRSIRHPPSC